MERQLRDIHESGCVGCAEEGGRCSRDEGRSYFAVAGGKLYTSLKPVILGQTDERKII